MKKVFFSFAIATMMASLMACGGKTGQNQDGQDSAAVEAEAEAEAADPNREELLFLSAAVPEGYTNNSISEYKLFLRQEPEPNYNYNSERLYLEVNFCKNQNVEKYIGPYKRFHDVTERPDLKTTIDGVDFQAFSIITQKDTTLHIIAEQGENLIEIITNELSYGNADIQQAIKSIKFK